MKSLRTAFILFVLFLASLSCAPKQQKKAATVRFPMVQVPSMLEGAERFGYLAVHFWDEYFKLAENGVSVDSTIVGGVEVQELEQAMANYLAVLENLPLDEACAAVSSFTGKLVSFEEADSSTTVFESVSSLFEKYVYDPNSPLRDEDLYTPYARNMSQCGLVAPEKREAYAEDARLTLLNRRGTRAADFSFTDRHGRRYTLYGTKADRTVLFFSNPGCTACKEIIDALSQDEMISGMIASGSLAVLNIYIDEDIRGWLDYMPIYPEIWYNGFDDSHMVRDEELYNVRAIPSLYLLDADKTVLLKDATPDNLINTIYSNETVS